MTTVVQVFERDQFTTVGTPKPVATIATAKRRQFRNVKNDYGTGTISIPLTDTTAVAACQPGRLLNFERNGVVRGCLLIGPRRYDTIQQGEENEQVLIIEAPGCGAVLNYGRVQPYRGGGGLPWAKQRPFDYSNPYLDTSGWGYAVELWRQGDAADLSASNFIEVVRDQGRFAFGPPEGWTDADAMWVWSSGYTGTGGSGGSGTLHMTPGVSYFEGEFTLADAVFAKPTGAADDFLELTIDGVIMFTTSPAPEEAWSRSREKTTFLSAGAHKVRIKAEGFTRAFTDGNISALLAAVLELNPVDESMVSVLAHTDATWRALHLPATPPGFAAGDIVLLLLTEIQTAAIPALLDINPTFTATHDTDGNAFPILTDVVVDVGDGLGEVLRQLAALGAVDWRLNPDMTLDLWVQGSHGTDTGKVYTVGQNVLSLSLDGDDTAVSSLLVVCADAAPFVVGDATAGRQGFFDAGEMPGAAATTAAEAELANISQARMAITLEVKDGPFDDFDIMDTVVAPDPDLDPARTECVAITWSEHEANEVERLYPEFGDLVLDPVEKKRLAAARLANGHLAGSALASPPGGGSLAVTPLGQGGGQFGQKAAPRETIYHRTSSDVGTVSDPYTVAASGTFSEFAVTFDAAQAGSVDVVLKVNGTTRATATMAAGATYVQVAGIGFPLAKYTDVLTVYCADVGFGFTATVVVS